ncbi:MAG TPA: FAD-binding oxidoreductase, partial [Candidatus Saccharimonadia bacterium]|nr:FAD-binding oxidoreductase [Candidatus Saccharimonadia bacterium]
ARGAGASQSGAALGSGILLVFPAHMNRILEIDTKANTVAVEPGINFGKLQQTLFTHGRFLPPYPASLEYSTVGGAVADNSSGEKSIKYGDMANYVKSLRVVLANGEVIETKRLSKRELSKKLGLATFEGEIYRSVDTLIEEQHELLERLPRLSTRNNSGYNLTDVKRKDGSFDLSPLFAGSQGSLGIITEAVLSTEPHSPTTTLFMAKFDSLENTQNTVLELREMSDKPSVIELIDGNVLQQVNDVNPNLLKEIVTAPFPPVMLFVEFDGSEKSQKKAAKKARKIFEKYAVDGSEAIDPEEQQSFWKVRQAVSSLIGHNDGLLRAIPLFDAAVTPDRLREYLEGLYALLEANNLKPAVWGQAGDAMLRAQPRLNLGQIGDRQKIFRLLSEHNKLVLSLGGTISAQAGDGRLRTPYLESMFGPELYALLDKVKKIFDPYGTLNPGVKFGTSLDDIKGMIRPDFSLDHIYDHLPRS